MKVAKQIAQPGAVHALTLFLYLSAIESLNLAGSRWKYLTDTQARWIEWRSTLLR